MSLSDIALAKLAFVGLGFLIFSIFIRPTMPVMSEFLWWVALLIILYSAIVRYLRRKH